MKHFKNIISFLLSLVLMFTLMLSVFLMFYKSTLVNEDFYIKVMNDNTVTDQVYDSLQKELKYILVKNNIKQGDMGEIITKEQVSEDMKSNIVNIKSYFIGTREDIPAIDTTKYVEQVDSGLQNYVKNNGVVVTNATTDVFNAVKVEAGSTLTSELQIVNFSELSKSPNGNKIRNIMTKVNNSGLFVGILGIDVLIAIILLIMWRKRIHRGIAWIGYSFMASGLLMTLTFVSGYMSKFYNNAPISPDYIKESIAGIIQGYLLKLSTYGIGLIVIGLILMAIYWAHLYKRQKRSISTTER